MAHARQLGPLRKGESIVMFRDVYVLSVRMFTEILQI
jgi:hypothetical protein